MLSIRMNPDIDASDEQFKQHQVNLLFCDDGSQKGLAAFLNLVGLASLEPKLAPEEFQDSKVQALLVSLLQIPSIMKQEANSALDSQILRIIKQNQDAQAQPVSSFGWALLLRSMTGLSEEVGFDEALRIYNGHPSVQQMTDKDA